MPYIRDLEPPLGRLTFALSDSHENVAHAACDMGRPLESTSMMWETNRNSEVTVNVTLTSLLECDIDRDELQSMWRLIAYYYDSPALLDRGAKHENASELVGFKYSQVVNEDAAYFTDLKGHLMAEPPWLLQPRISLQLNQRKTTTKKLVLNFATLISSHKPSHDQGRPSWALIQREKATQIQSVIQGSNVTFECGIQSSEQRQVEWMLPDSMLLEKSDLKNIITEDNKLHVKNVTLLDSGLYHCLVKSEMDVDILSFRLAVREQWPSPSALNGKSIILESGGVLTLDCWVSSTFPTETSWYLPNSEILKTSQSNQRESVLQNNTLVIKNVNSDDTGVYSCLSVNLYGVNMLSHHVVITGQKTEAEELVNINKKQSPSSTEIEIEIEGSGYEEIGHQFPKQHPFKERIRGKHRSGKLNKSVQGMGGTYWAKKMDKKNGHGRSPAPNTQITLLASETEVTDVLTTTMAATVIAVFTTSNVDDISSTGLGKHVSEQNVLDFNGGNSDTITLQSKTDNTDTKTKLKLRNRLNKNVTQIQRPLRRRRPPMRRPHPSRYSNKDTIPETSRKTTSWNETRNRNHLNEAPTDVNINGRHRFRNSDTNSQTTMNQSYNDYRKVDTTNIDNMYTTKHAENIFDSTRLEGKQEKEKDTKNENVSSKNISTKRNETKENEPTITSTTFYPKYGTTAINLPSSATPPTQRPHTFNPRSAYHWNIQQWHSPVTSHPEIPSWSLKPTTSIFHPDQIIAPYPTHHPSLSSAKQFLRVSRLRDQYRQSWLNTLSLQVGRLPTLKPWINTSTPPPKQVPKISVSYKPTTPPSITATSSPYSTTSARNNSQWHYRYGRTKKPSISVPFPNLMASGLKPHITSTNTAVVFAPPEADASLPCQATGSPKPMISWRSMSTGATIQGGIHQKEMSKFEVLQNGTLMVKNLKSEDEGQYLCLAQNRFGLAHSVATLVVMTGAPKIVRSPSKDFSLPLGKSINLHCIAQGKPKPQISWMLPDKTVLHEVGTYAVASLFANGTLNIPSVTASTKGYYKCIASNIAGKDTVTYNISVTASLPTINEKATESLAVSLGTSIYVHCSAKGQPQPVVKWSFPEGSCSKATQRLKGCPYVFPNGTLYIRSVSVTDGGRYDCTATNPVGSVKRLFLLDTRLDSYLPKENEQKQHITAIYGSTVYLYCCHHGPVWRLPSKKLLAHHYSPERFITAFPNGTLRIQHLTEKLAGTYMCMSQKADAEDTHFQVEVIMKPPKLENTRVSLISVPYGENLQVDCIYSDALNPEISWRLPDGTVIKSDDNQRHLGHYVIFGNGTLLLKQITKKDEGDYVCHSKNASGEDEIKVSVRVLTASPTAIPKTEGSVWAELGKPAHMKCKSHKNPLSPVMWLSPNNNVISFTSDHHQILKDGTLLIKKVTLGDEGRYICLARNSAINDIKLEVKNKEPYIDGQRGDSSKYILAVTYQTVLMDCKTEGKPEAHITWTSSSGLSMTMPYVGGRFQVHKNGSLELRGVRKSDEGQFKCFAKNDLGEASLSVTLKVETLAEKPSFSNPNIEIYPIKSDGIDITLDCSATGKPRPLFVWVLPNNTQLNPGTRLHRLRHFTGSGTLHIANPVATDKGIYRCLAKNVAGEAEKRYELRTGQKPYIRGNGGPIKITFGQTLKLPCAVESWPDASVSWTLPNGLTLVKPQVTERVTFQVNNTLQVKDAATFDRGTYICKATNAYGSSFLSYPVTVMVHPPQITSAPPSIVKAYRGKSVTLNCIADGIPKPDISWTLPGRTTLVSSSRFTAQGGIHLTEDGSLVIQDPGLMHSGIYKCNAKNLLGTVFKATYLQVV
ncbi:hypothetical protein ACEWY4_027366 [Coilia grayii]|uniref:Ig-like domain-containing protein n=1 Tax=Coilia grayii TaxID=363190 RepID=A0ABD1ISS3_9TELE